MLIPAMVSFITLMLTILIVGGVRRSRNFLVALSVLLWLSSLLSAYFVSWGWLERSYSENWAMYGVLFISLPVIIANGVFTVAVLVVASVRGIENRKRLSESLYLQLLFLMVQVGFVIWAA